MRNPEVNSTCTFEPIEEVQLEPDITASARSQYINMMGCNIGGCIFKRGYCDSMGTCMGGDPVSPN